MRKIYKYTKYIHLQSCHFLQECALLIFHCLTSPLGTRSRRRPWPAGASETRSKIREGGWQIIADSLLYWFKYAFGNNWCMNMYMIELDCMTDLTDITWPILGMGTGFGCLLPDYPRGNDKWEFWMQELKSVKNLPDWFGVGPCL